MKKHFFFLTCPALLLAFFFSHASLQAQTPDTGHVHEIGLQFQGIQFAGFNSFTAVYKKQQENGSFRRIRGTVGSLSINSDQVERVSGSLNGGISIGTEKRKALGERTTFFRGPEFGASFGFSKTENVDPFWSISPEFGYVLGIQHQISRYFAINLEIVPGANLNLRKFPQRVLDVYFSTYFSNSASLSLMYCF